MNDEYVKLLVEKVDKIQSGVSDIEKRMVRIDQKFTDHVGYAEKLEQDIKTLKLEAANLEGRVATLEHIVKEAAEQRAALAAQRDELAARVAEVDREAARKREEIAARVDENSRMSDRVAILTRAVPYIISVAGAVVTALGFYFVTR